MVTMYDVPINDLIQEVAKELKGMSEIRAPEWAAYVKTGVHKERPPLQSDWWHIRAAAVLRTVAVRGPIGVSKIRAKYGGRKNRGVKPEHTYKGSGSIARKILQQLEAAGLVEQAAKGVHKGRVVTKKGLKLLNEAAKRIHKPAQKKEESKGETAKKAAKTPKEGSKESGSPKETPEESKESPTEEPRKEEPAEKQESEKAGAQQEEATGETEEKQ
ncbi:30S ribosomal protein S19e [Candidatus Woesearchaeota archaeon]|nr:MAG: 30S ribosomal protein S19e [Candidatus Woesearchaeota archaeon]